MALEENQPATDLESVDAGRPPHDWTVLAWSAPAPSRPAPRVLDRRAHERYAVDCPATLILISSPAQHRCRLLDLSLGGCRVLTEKPFQPETLFRLEVQFTFRGVTFRALAEAVGRRGHLSFGLRFLDMPERRKSELAQLLLEADRQTTLQPEFPPAATRASAIYQPQPISDRRRNHRLQVDLAARIWLVKPNICMSGRMVNLGQGGCRMRTECPFTMGIYVRLEIEFSLRGLPFRFAAVTESIQGKDTIGVRFLDLSERKVEPFLALLREMEEEALPNSP